MNIIRNPNTGRPMGLARQRDLKIAQAYLDGYEIQAILKEFHINQATLVKALKFYEDVHGKSIEKEPGDLSGQEYMANKKMGKINGASSSNYVDNGIDDEDDVDIETIEGIDNIQINNKYDSHDDEYEPIEPKKVKKAPVHHITERAKLSQNSRIKAVKPQEKEPIKNPRGLPLYDKNPPIPRSQKMQLQGTRAKVKNSVLDEIDPKLKLKLYTDYQYRMPMKQLAEKYGISILTVKKVINECLVVLK